MLSNFLSPTGSFSLNTLDKRIRTQQLSQSLTNCVGVFNSVVIIAVTFSSICSTMLHSSVCPLINKYKPYSTYYNSNIHRLLFHFDQAYVFEEENGECVAFLINNDRRNNVTVQFHNSSHELLPKSISILPDCQNVVFNTANVSYNFIRINYIYTALIL